MVCHEKILGPSTSILAMSPKFGHALCSLIISPETTCPCIALWLLYLLEQREDRGSNPGLVSLSIVSMLQDYFPLPSLYCDS